MDKEEATRILAAELVKAKGQKFVINPAHQKHLLEKAISYCPIEYEKPFSLKIRADYFEDKANAGPIMMENKQGVMEYCSKVSDANYVFTKVSQSLGVGGTKYSIYPYISLLNSFSFFALIGEKEEIDLINLFYKDVSERIVEAFEVLEIPTFIEQYKAYTSLSEEDDSLIGLYTPFKKGEAVEVGDIVQGWSSKKYYLVDKVGRNGDIGGHKFLDEFLKKPYEGKNRYGTCERGYAIPVKKFYSEEFVNFIFNLPYEDQNVTANKIILKEKKSVNLCKTLAKEYAKGKYFEEYFSILDEEDKQKVVDGLKNVPRNLIYDSFLWNNGFKNVDPDYLKLYKENTEGFIEYFSSKSSHEERKTIIGDVLKCEHMNQEVIDWLDVNEPEILREVSFNG